MSSNNFVDILIEDLKNCIGPGDLVQDLTLVLKNLNERVKELEKELKGKEKTI